MRRELSFTFVFSTWVLASWCARAEMTWDLTAEFSIDNGNPNGAWSYGWSDGDNGFRLFGANTLGTCGPIWRVQPYETEDPIIWMNTSGETAGGAAPGQVSLHPGKYGVPSVARWTAPAGVEGMAHVQGQFFAGDTGSLIVSIWTNGMTTGQVAIWDEWDAGTFDLNIPVSPGKTIDFAVYSGYIYGTTPLDARITALPEPSSVALLGGGATVVFAAARRFRKKPPTGQSHPSL